MLQSNSVRRIVVGLALLFLVGLCVATSANAQTQYSAAISGTVIDPSGAAVSGAKVTVSSPERGITHDYTTESNGFYLFSQLPPGVYNLDVEVAGFKHFKQEGITLAAGQTADQPVALEVGAVTEEVSVTAQAPQLNAENANIASDINSQQVEELPLNLRNVYGLAFLNSSVSNTAEFQIVGGNGISGSADQDISFFNFGGTFFNTAEYLLDGTWDTGADWGGVAYVPSVDDVQEFKIQTNAFTAQYGWSSGNVINVVTKSGTNAFHGDAYEFYRNSAMDARNYFNDGAATRFPSQPIWRHDRRPDPEEQDFLLRLLRRIAPSDPGNAHRYRADGRSARRKFRVATRRTNRHRQPWPPDSLPVRFTTHSARVPSRKVLSIRPPASSRYTPATFATRSPAT